MLFEQGDLLKILNNIEINDKRIEKTDLKSEKEKRTT